MLPIMNWAVDLNDLSLAKISSLLKEVYLVYYYARSLQGSSSFNQQNEDLSTLPYSLLLVSSRTTALLRVITPFYFPCFN